MKDEPKPSAAAVRVVLMMLEGHAFTAKTWPVLRKPVREELQRLGFVLQQESPRHEGTWFYPLHKEQFRNRATELGITPPQPARQQNVNSPKTLLNP